MSLCRNGLHELDPNDPWRSSNGTRCRDCYLAAQRRYNRSEPGLKRWLDYYDRRWDDHDPIRRVTFRAKEGMRKRRHHALKRMAERNRRRREDAA